MAILGELEQKVMDALWHAPGLMSVREVHSELVKEKDLAYTTVMTVLDRLAKKGLVERERDGRQWMYRPAASRADLVAGQIMELLHGTLDERRDVFGVLAARLEPADRTQLAELL